jgi:hypothetical protein
LLLVLLVVVIDAGLALRSLVILNGAAREGARVASSSYSGTLPDDTVRTAVVQEAGDLGIVNDAAHIDVVYLDPTSVQVTVRYDYSPLTPLARAVWGNPVVLQSTATFHVPAPTATPPPITPSTPVPTPTSTPAGTATPTLAPTGTATPTPTPTRTLTPTPTPTPGPCTVTVSIPALAKNNGYWVTVTSVAPGTIQATWTLASSNDIEVDIYAGNPLAGFTNPTTTKPGGALVKHAATTAVLTVVTPSEPAGTYTAFFWNPGAVLGSASTGAITYTKAVCP